MRLYQMSYLDDADVRENDVYALNMLRVRSR
jgi:hypothetical protein